MDNNPANLLNYYMTQLFGTAWQRFAGTGDSAGVSAISPGFSEAIYTFNMFSTLAVGVLIFAITALAVLNTATDGEPLGKKYNTTWTPIRMATSLILVVPVKSFGGLNVVQALVLFAAGLSVFGANKVYDKIMSGFAETGTIFANAAAVPKVDLAQNMLKSEMCYLTLKHKFGKLGYANLTIMKKHNDTIGAPHYYIRYGKPGSEDPICGSFEVDCRAIAKAASKKRGGSWFSNLFGGGRMNDHSNEIALKSCRVAGNSLLAMQPGIHSMAVKIFKHNGGGFQGADFHGISQDYSNAITNYFTTYNKKMASMLSATQPGADKAAKDLYASSKNMGWLFAGAWYLATTRKSAEVARYTKGADQNIKGTLPSLDSFSDIVSQELMTQFSKADHVLRKVSVPVAAKVSEKTGITISSVSDLKNQSAESIASRLFYEPMGPIFKSWRLLYSSDMLEGQPLKALANLGTNIGAVAGVMFSGSLAAYSVSRGAQMAADNSLLTKVPGPGEAGSFLIGTAIGAVEFITSFVKALFYALVLIAFMLTTFMPMIPAVYWSFAVLGWMMSLLVIFLAAPLWAAVHAMPDDRGNPVSMWAVNGYQMLFGVLIKPSLMVLFLFAASVLASAGVALTSGIFDIAGITTMISDDSAISFGAGNLLQSIGLLFLYAVVVVTIVYKSFTLIFIGPDRAIDVLGWKVLQSGIEDTEGRVHGSAKEAGGAVGQAGARAGESLSGATKEGANRRSTKMTEGRTSSTSDTSGGDTKGGDSKIKM